MHTKPVSIVVSGSRQPARSIALAPRATVRDALRAANLDAAAYEMHAPDSGRLLSGDDVLFDIADSGDELEVSSKLDAG